MAFTLKPPFSSSSTLVERLSCLLREIVVEEGTGPKREDSQNPSYWFKVSPGPRTKPWNSIGRRRYINQASPAGSSLTGKQTTARSQASKAIALDISFESREVLFGPPRMALYPGLRRRSGADRW